MAKIGFRGFIEMLRRSFNMNISTFACELGVSHSQVLRWIAGETIPSSASCEKIKRLFQRALSEHRLSKPQNSAYDTDVRFIDEFSQRSQAPYDPAKYPYHKLPDGFIPVIQSRRSKRSRHRVPMPPLPVSMINDYANYMRIFKLEDYSKSPGLPDLCTCICRMQNWQFMSDLEIAHDIGMKVKTYRDIRDCRRTPDAWELQRMSEYVYHRVLHNDKHDEIFGPDSRYDYEDDPEDSTAPFELRSELAEARPGAGYQDLSTSTDFRRYPRGCLAPGCRRIRKRWHHD
jgi:transcriptional regulator with XRE-family HTH domain